MNLNILDDITPITIRKAKCKALPWLNDHTRDLKRQCRRVEHRWKKYKLAVSFGILKSLMLDYQQVVKDARDSYFSNLIASNCHNPRVLFQTINSVLNPPPSQHLEAFTELCEQFLPICDQPSAIISNFKQISLLELEVLTSHLSSSTCHLDTIPPRLIEEVFQTATDSVFCQLLIVLWYFPIQLQKCNSLTATKETYTCLRQV